MSKAHKTVIIVAASHEFVDGLVEGFLDSGYGVVVAAGEYKKVDDPDVVVISGDIFDISTASQALVAALATVGRVDTLVNYIEVPAAKPLLACTAGELGSEIAQLVLVFNIVQLVAKPMLAKGGGHIINVFVGLHDETTQSDRSTITSFFRGTVQNATRSMARELYPESIRVNAIAPALHQPLPLDEETDYRSETDLQLTRSGRIGELVNAVLFLEMTTKTTGTTLEITIP